MALWPLAAHASITTPTASTAASTGYATVAASATPHTKGAWVQVTAATGGPIEQLALHVRDVLAANSGDTSTLVDIGVGASGSEVVVAPNLLLGHNFGNPTITLPLRIPAGVRVALRMQSAVASKSALITVVLSESQSWLDVAPFASVATTYGADTATSNGTLIPTPGSVNSKGAWVEITASTTRPARFLLPMFANAPADTAVTTINNLVDIGIGAAGSEQVIVPNLFVHQTTAEAVVQPYVAVPVNIPAGTRLSMRYQKSNIADAVHGVIVALD